MTSAGDAEKSEVEDKNGKFKASLRTRSRQNLTPWENVSKFRLEFVFLAAANIFCRDKKIDH